MTKTHQDIVESAPFHKTALSILSEEEYQALLDTLSENPTAGDIMKGTGGCRKIRVALGNKGKSGGARVIFFFKATSGRVYPLAIFTKAAHANLTAAERAEIKQLVKTLE